MKRFSTTERRQELQEARVSTRNWEDYNESLSIARDAETRELWFVTPTPQGDLRAIKRADEFISTSEIRDLTWFAVPGNPEPKQSPLDDDPHPQSLYFFLLWQKEMRDWDMAHLS